MSDHLGFHITSCVMADLKKEEDCIYCKSDGPLSPPRRMSFGVKVVVGVLGGSALVLSVGALPFVVPAFRRICLPYVPATETQIKNVMSALRVGGQSGSLIDIGSGDGRIVIAAAKNGFYSDGVELNPWLVLYSRISARIAGVGKLTRFSRKDLWRSDLSSYNNVVIFGVEEMMSPLKKKLNQELAGNAVVVACRYPFPECSPDLEIGEGVDAVWLYKSLKSKSGT